LLESMEEDVDGESYGEDEDEDEDEFKTRPPSLSELFHPGQYIRAIVTAVHAPGTTNATGIAKARDEASKASRRVELSLVPGCVNVDVHKADLRPGFVRGYS
jgi:rRNA biogenesis protein RRP5